MGRFSARYLMIACASMLLTACFSPPPPQHPEVAADAPFPNLADVPPRPVMDISVSEREKLRRDLMDHNAEANMQLPPQGTAQ